MICETCTDALDDTSCLTLEDHACEGDPCGCKCRALWPASNPPSTPHTFPYVTCEAPGCTPETHKVAGR